MDKDQRWTIAQATASEIIGDAKRQPDDPLKILALMFVHLVNERARQDCQHG